MARDGFHVGDMDKSKDASLSNVYVKELLMFQSSRWWSTLAASLWLGVFFFVSSHHAQATLFQGDGKDYVVYVDGKLWIFSKFPSTSVTVRDLSTNQVVWSPTFAQSAQMATQAFTRAHLRVTSDQPINVATGNLLAHNDPNNANLSHASYLISETGSRLGQSFIGFVASDVIVFCHKGPLTGTNPTVTIEDLSEPTGPDNDDKTLTISNSTVDKTSITIWQRGGFDDDLVRITANQDCAVMVAHNLHAKALADWSVLPPSMEPGEGGLAYGTRFYLFVPKTMAITALEDNTKVSILDLSDGDDNANLTLNRNEVYTPVAFGQTYNGYSQKVVSVGGFDDDYVEVIADKPVWVYVGPTSQNNLSHSVAPVSIPIGNGQQEAYCFVQKGSSNNLQVFVDDNTAQVEITTIAGDAGITTTKRQIGGQGGQSWSGPTGGPYWWEANSFSNELVFIRSTKPMSVLCGGLGGPSWQSYMSYETLNNEPEFTIPNNQFKYTIRVGDTLTLTISATDPNGDTMTWNLSWSTTSGNPPQGANVTGTGNQRTLSWTPIAGQEGTYFWSIEVSDNGVPSLTTRIDIEIEVVSGPSNRPPVFVSTIPPTVAVQIDSPFTYTARAVDPDGDPVTMTMTTFPPGASFNTSTGVVSWQASSAAGVKVGDSFSFTIRACDNKNACTDQTWVVRVERTNRPPVFVSSPPLTVREGDLLDYQPQLTDPDPGDQGALRFTAVDVVDPLTNTTATGVSVNINTGRIIWTPNSQQGGRAYWCQITACDPQGACVTQSWSLQVIDVISNPPRITSTPPTKVDINVTYTYSPTFVDADLPNDSHTWTLNLAPSSARFDNNNGRITWTPSGADANQTYAFELVICDRTQRCDTQRWSVSVGSANRPPVITSTPPTFDPVTGRIYFYQATATDPDPNEILLWALLQGPAGATLGQNTGTLQWTPNASDRGRTVTFTIQVCDRANACATQSWTKTVLGPNQPPTFLSQPPTSVVQNQLYSYTIRATDPDPGDTVTITLTNGPTGATINTTGGNVVLEWQTGSPNGGRSYNFTVQACDQLNNCTEQRWQLFVININDAPKITSTPSTKGTVSVAYTYQPQATDDDLNDTLTWELRNSPTGVNVTFDIKTGSLTWTPGTGDNGKSFSFTIRVYDTAREFDEQTWTVLVGSTLNNPPQITSTPVTNATEDQPYSYKPTASDPDPGDQALLTWKLDQGPTGASINATTGEITWTPGDADVTNSPVPFKITVCDPGGACASQSWTVTVANVNDPPKFTSQPSANSGKIGSVFTYPSTATDPDPADQGKLVFSLTTPHGNAAINPTTGEFTWTPQAADANQTVSFTLRVCDPQNACDTQTFSINVGAGNSPPKIVSNAPTAAYVGEDIKYQAVAVDPDVGDILTWKLVSGPNNASMDQKTGLVSWTPTVNDYGQSFPFTIEVCDNANPPACDRQSFTLKVENKCRLDIHCPGKDICVQQGRFRICVPPGCSLVSAPCNPQFFCKDGTCTRDKCPDPNCTTQICRPDTGCIRSCAGVTCPAGSLCVDGSCEPTPCIANACKSGEVCDSSDTVNPACVSDPCQIPGQCKHDRLCANDRCIDDPCKFMKCSTGQICFAGQCQDPKTCEVDIDCAANQVCENKRCVEPGCYVRSPRCQNQTDLCLATSCKENPCSSGGVLQCTTDQFCRPTDGKCGNVCDKTAQDKCSANEKCRDGLCQRDPCAGLSCGSGQTCVDGVCVTNRCSAGNVCKHGRICNAEANRCQDDPCLYMRCPAGLDCRLGQCVPRGCRVDKDCPGTQLCINGGCREPKCPNTPCPPGELCVDGQCTPDPCLNKQCPTGQYCRAGQCIDPCASCPAGARCVDGKCVTDPCANVSCPKDQVCQNGSCVPECCTTDSCKNNRICRACQCFNPPCQGVTCPGSNVCNKDTGNCEPPTGACDVDKNQCPNNDVCINGKCEPPGCYTEQTCADGKVCINGKCEDNPCKNKQCKDNETCRPSDGLCVPVCDCKPGQVCNNGVCEANPCDGKTCPQGQICKNGNCETTLPCDKTENANDNICKHGRVCKNNTVNVTAPKANCGDSLCAGMTCKSGYLCRSGQCWPDPCAGENPAESCAAEGSDESTADGGVSEGDGGTERDTVVEFTTIATGGCGCSTQSSSPLAVLLLILAAFFVFRRRSSAAVL